MTESLHTFIARLIFTIEALQQSRSIGFALASFRNTHPSLQATVIDGVQQSTDAGMCPSEVKAYNAHQSFIRFHNGQNDYQLDTGVELPALSKPSGGAVSHTVNGEAVNRFGEKLSTVSARIIFGLNNPFII
jgi:hypothetical protein